MSSDQPPLYVHGLSTAVPGAAIAQDDIVEHMRIACHDARTHTAIRRIARQTSVQARHLAALNTDKPLDALYQPVTQHPCGPGMGERNQRFHRIADQLVETAAHALIHDQLEEITSLVTVTCTQASSPGLEMPLFRHLPLPTTVQRWNLGFMGCSAGLAALRLVHQLNPAKHHALICTCELSSLHFQYSQAIDQITANLLFADGLALVHTSAQPSRVAVRACQAVHLPDAADQMHWFADDHGLRLTLARDLPDTLNASIHAVVEAFLDAHGFDPNDIAHWIVHPGGPQILDAVQSALALPNDALDESRTVLRTCGNMSSSTIFFILQRLLHAHAAGLCVALAFGPGLTIELALLDLRCEPPPAD